ncbi:MAG TPA: ABC transporter, partial [Chloroflexi bacterium]|nr:ABC transporter [Chloroflexota bacterium]
LKIINGDYQPDVGTLMLDGREVVFANPRAAHHAGIRVIYQEPEIIPGVDVAENIWVGELPKRFGMIDRGRLNAEVQRSLAEYGFENVLPMNLMGDQLSSAQRQIVEIMRALKSGVRVLALDEPTSSLTDDEVDRLFALVRRLRDEGVAIIYVSHRIKEILQLCDRVAILRDGRLIAVRPAAELTDAEIVRLMVGRDLTDVFQRRPAGA